MDRLVERFDKKDPEIFFRDLAQLRQTGSLETYISEFQRLSVMVQDVSERRLVILFTEGLSEPLKGWIKAFDPPTLQEAMRKARSMELTAPSSRFTSRSTSSFRDNKKFDKNKGKNVDTKGKSTTHLDTEALNDLRRKKLCFYCKGPYDRDHDCPLRPKGKANRVMWAYYEGSDSDSTTHEDDHSDTEPKGETEVSEHKEEPELHLQQARLSSIQQEGSFRLRGVLAGQKVITLVEPVASEGDIIGNAGLRDWHGLWLRYN